MKIVNSGYDYRHPASFKIHRANGSGDWTLLVLRSPAYFLFEEERVLTGGNSAVLYRRGTPQIYGALDAEFINDWVHFEITEEEIARIEGLEIPFDTVIPLPNASLLSSLIKSICREQYSASRHSEEAARLYFELLLLKFSELLTSAEDANRSYLYRQFAKIREEIYLSPQKELHIEDLARRLSLSLSYFQHRYKQFFGTNVKKDITQARMEYAKHLLCSTEDRVYCIAQLCGYENEVHFMRIFKAHTGFTPSAFRRLSNGFRSNEAERVK